MGNLNLKLMAWVSLAAMTTGCSNGFKSMSASSLGALSNTTVLDNGSAQEPITNPNPDPGTGPVVQSETTEQVKLIFQDVLGRMADDAGLKYWVDQVTKNGASLEDVRQGLAKSPEARELVRSYFKSKMGREPLASELSALIEKLMASHTLAQVQQVIQGLISANESHIQAIKAIYLDVLGRTADQDGLNFFVEKMASGLSLADVRATVAHSTEAKTLVTNLYLKLLKRSPTAAELQSACAKMANGQRLASIESQLASLADVSAGFEAQVKSLYQQMLLRNAETAGLDFWVQFLQAGGSVTDLRKLIATSPEAKTIIAGMYQSYHVRAATAAEIEAHSNKLAALGMSMLTIENDIISAANADPAIKFVKNLYREALNRDSEIAGLRAWVNLIRNNNTVSTCQAVNRAFYNSTEFQSRNLGPSEFVESMYRGILGRPSDSGGKIFWLNRLLETPSYSQKVEFFVTSEEGIARCRSALGAR